jgi:hypothetical protein
MITERMRAMLDMQHAMIKSLLDENARLTRKLEEAEWWQPIDKEMGRIELSEQATEDELRRAEDSVLSARSDAVVASYGASSKPKVVSLLDDDEFPF